ncbi:glycosyltransferase family 2 protein [Xylanimonas protaetiae]|uniref:glycosyltransferase family 2 protein n=1 Tax=Xylanimonas protaetiae TaxID=2509457 RepID=UPI0013E9C4CC|nr:glycosyltransferase [Xylanimonas protaetiae]
MSDTDEPLVSVVVATDRGGPFLAEALHSAVGQTYGRIEIVVVDDGASDPETIAAIVAREPRVRLVRQRNTGVSVARNAGVALTSGDLLVFLDDDDRWHPDRIRRQVDALLSNPDAVLSYCGMRSIDAHGSELVAADQFQVADAHEVLQRRTGIILPNIMIRRSAFVRVGGFHPAFRRAQDLDLVLKAALEGDFVFVPDTLVDYRTHSGNNTSRHRELVRSIDHVIRLHRWNALEKGRLDIVADHDISLRANARFTAWSSARAARRLAKSGHVLAALGELLWSVRAAPTAPFEWVRHRLPRWRTDTRQRR